MTAHDALPESQSATNTTGEDTINQCASYPTIQGVRDEEAMQQEGDYTFLGNAQGENKGVGDLWSVTLD